MLSSLLPGLVLWPALASLAVPLVGATPAGRRGVLFPLAHLIGAALAALAVMQTPSGAIQVIRFGTIPAQLGLDQDHFAGTALLVSALVLLSVSGFSRSYVRGARQGAAFLSFLLLEQCGVNLSLLAEDLFTLYAGLVILSLSLMLLIGVDFVARGGSAALRVVATLEVPAALALAAFWLVDAHAGTVSLAALARDHRWLNESGSWLLLLPILVALICRAGLVPFQNWIIAGSRAAILPASVAVAGVAAPVGGLILARLIDGPVLLPPSGRLALLALGGLTVVVAGAGALRESTVAGWLGYLATGEAGLAAVGFVEGSSAGRLAGLLELATLAVAVPLIGLALASVPRAGTDRPGDAFRGLPNRWRVCLPLATGLLILLPVPLLPSFTARWLLLGRLLAADALEPRVVAAMVLLGLLLLAASIWRVVAGTLEPRAKLLPAISQLVPRQRPIRRGLLALAVLLVLGGTIQPLWLDVGGESVLVPSGLIAVLLVSVALLGGASVSRATAPRWRPGRLHRWLAFPGKRVRLNLLADPYLLIGWLLLTLGRLSAALLDQTLGRLARSP